MKKIFVLLYVSLMFLFVGCNNDKPTEPTNSAPRIQSVTASPSSIKINETTTLTCVATDPDGDNLTYSWLAESGTFPNGTTGPSVIWIAPNEEDIYQITVIVNDGKTTVQKDKNITVYEKGPPCPGVPTVTYEGKTYHTVQIGNQCWLRENLDVGTMIESNGAGQLQTDNGVIEKYCYGNDVNNCNTYGGLYEWNEAMQYTTQEGAQGICPDGWHIPTNSEWATLQSYVNNEATKLIDENVTRGGYTFSNETGFSALLAGGRYPDGGFYNLSNNALFWSSTENGSSASSVDLFFPDPEVNLEDHNMTYGFSIRCIKN